MSNADDLFNKWMDKPLHKGKGFVKDGIIDPERRWNQVNLKILFLMKEAYENDKPIPQGYDLCRLIREEWKGPKSNIWWRVAQWAYGLQELATGRKPIFPGNSDQVKEALLSSAIINIKKSGGKTKSNPEDLAQYVEQDWDLLKEQIDRIGAEIIVCGYTWPLIKSRMNPFQTLKTKLVCKTLVNWTYDPKERTFINFWHPANPYPSEMNFYTLCYAVDVSGVLDGKGREAHSPVMPQ